jgi:hypothetical protein
LIFRPLLFQTDRVIRTHVLEAHGVTLEQLEGSTPIGATWTLGDGRVWMRELRPEEA